MTGSPWTLFSAVILVAMVRREPGSQPQRQPRPVDETGEPAVIGVD